jgi:hypothetical protein
LVFWREITLKNIESTGAPKSKKNGGLPVIKLVGIWSELGVCTKGMVRK